MSRKTKKKRKLQIGHYVIAFIDLLGQQELLRKLKDLPEQKSDNDFFDTIKNTYGAVNAVQQSLDNFYSAYNKNQIDTSNFTGEQKQFIREYSKPQIKFQRFSDCIAIYSPLYPKANVTGVYGIIGAVASTFTTCLACGHPIRGGIDIGLAMEVRKNEIYGPALSRAYTLESKTANYPRIVIGEELENFLRSFASTETENKHDIVNRNLAQTCLQNLAVDNDGYPIIDYLGKPFLDAIPVENRQEIIDKCYNFIKKQLEQHKLSRNTKLANKYTLLLRYFENRVPRPT